MFLFGMTISYKTIEKSKIKIADKEFIDLVTNDIYNYENNNLINKIITKSIEKNNPIKLLNKEYTTYIKKTSINKI